MRATRYPSPSMIRSSARLASIVAALGLTTGCYRNAPVAVADLKPGQEVQLNLSATAVDRLRRSTDDVKALEGFKVAGQVARLSADSVVVKWENGMLDANARAVTIKRDLPLLRTEINDVVLRTLDRKRTTIAGVALGAAIVTTAAVAIKRGGRASGSANGGNNPPELRIPFSFGWLTR